MVREGSPEGLWIFSSPTCVGFRYGRLGNWLEDFLGSMASARLRPEGLPITFQGCLTTPRPICLPEPPTRLDPHFPSRAVLSLLRHPIARNVTTAEQEY